MNELNLGQWRLLQQAATRDSLLVEAVFTRIQIETIIPSQDMLARTLQPMLSAATYVAPRASHQRTKPKCHLQLSPPLLCYILPSLLIQHPPRCIAFGEGFSVALVRARVASGVALLRRQHRAIAQAAGESPAHSPLGLADNSSARLLRHCI